MFSVELRRRVSIPNQTQDRILAAAEHLNYRPNLFAPSLRKSAEPDDPGADARVSEGCTTLVLSGIKHELLHGAPAVGNDGHLGGSNGVTALARRLLRAT